MQLNLLLRTATKASTRLRTGSNGRLSTRVRSGLLFDVFYSETWNRPIVRQYKRDSSCPRYSPLGRLKGNCESVSQKPELFLGLPVLFHAVMGLELGA